MSFTVTATATTGTAQQPMAMTLKVVTGAAATQNGATVGTSGAISPPSASITPDASGSLIFGAEIAVVSTVYTPLASTTFYTNHYNGTSESFGSFVSSATTTASSPVTIGGSAPTGSPAGGIALAEILASGTLAVDSSSPPDTGFVDADTATTAAFTPPGGSLLVLMLSSNGGGGVSGFTITDTSGLGLAWTVLSQANGSGEGYAGVWIAQIPAASLAPPNRPRGQAVNRASTY